MIEYLEKCPSLVLTLVLYLSFATCDKSSEGYVEGNEDYGDDDSDYNLYGVPDSFEGLIEDSEQVANLYPYGGAWTDENGGMLIATNNDEDGEIRFALYDTDEDMAASGFIQFIPDYDYDYFYNEHNGMAYHSWFGKDGALHVTELGTPMQVTGGTPGENIGDGDYDFFAGVQYRDGDPGAANIIEFDAPGSWELLERPGDDGDPTMVDRGTIEMDQDGAGQYFAVSTIHTDVVYNFILVGDDIIYWDGGHNYYQKIE